MVFRPNLLLTHGTIRSFLRAAISLAELHLSGWSYRCSAANTPVTADTMYYAGCGTSDTMGQIYEPCKNG